MVEKGGSLDIDFEALNANTDQLIVKRILQNILTINIKTIALYFELFQTTQYNRIPFFHGRRKAE